jgi:hypothetical protein
MKLQFGQNQLILELSKSPFAWYHGHTERMRLTSLSVAVRAAFAVRTPAAPGSLSCNWVKGTRVSHQPVFLAAGVFQRQHLPA